LWKIKVPENAIKHIMKRHKDWIKMLGLEDVEEIRRLINEIISQPDEVYKDNIRRNVKYYLRKLDDKFLCVIVRNDEVATAYLINWEKYNKYRVKRWSLNLFFR